MFLSYLGQVYQSWAEELGFRKKLIGGGMVEFKVDEKEQFENHDDPTTFFTSGDKQTIVLEMINTLRAVDGDELGKIKFCEGMQIGKLQLKLHWEEVPWSAANILVRLFLVPKLMSEGVIEKLFPLHNEDDLVKLRKTWVKAFFKPQPIGKWRVSKYMGESILQATAHR